MRARIVALAGIIAVAACSGDPTNVETRTITSNGGVEMVTTSGDVQSGGQLADNSWATATTGGTMDQHLDANEWD
jgi:hypothetical protein